MTKDGFDTLGIKSDCRQPDPLECSERQTLYAQSGDEICLRCPVASWVRAMVASGAGTSAEADWPEVELLKTDEFLVTELADKAA